MSKNKKNNSTNTRLVEFNKGVIKDNVLAALVTSDLFKHKVFKKKKGKGSYSRKNKGDDNGGFYNHHYFFV